MISIRINKVPTLFIKAFDAEDVAEILEFVREAARFYRGKSNSVLFIDTPITSATVEAVERLHVEGFNVFVRDHHGIEDAPVSDRDRQVVAATEKLRHLLGEACNITVRSLHPACSTLVSVGEFKDAVAIIADPDPDGLTAAMKAAGITYPELDEDAAKLDSEPQMQVRGSPLSQLLAKGVATIPSYDPSKPKEREVAYQALFGDWVKTVEGDEKARRRLEAHTEVYDRCVEVSRDLAESAVEVAPHVVLVDTAKSELYDPGTLAELLEKFPGCQITVLRKSLGPIAAVHGIQYSLSVRKEFQQSIDLRTLVDTRAMSDPQGGIISNVSFLLHVSEDIWERRVLPALRT